jgi:DivIVA domain-containing protein
VGTGDGLAAPARLTPIDIQQKEFRVSRFGGYKMRDVDEFLDQITDAFSALTTEVERLRAGGGGAVVGSPDLDDVARQADELIARARAEAARITAEARASSAAAAVSLGGAQDQSAVNAFISREREFLQSLAGLVQEHAETVKGMAKSSRTAARTTPSEAAASVTAAESATPVAAAPVAPATPTAPTARAEGAPRKAEPTPAATPAAAGAPGVAAAAAETQAGPDASERASRPDASGPVAQPEPTRVPDSEATVRIDEPAPAAALSDGDAEGDRSLRELFWGED